MVFFNRAAIEFCVFIILRNTFEANASTNEVSTDEEFEKLDLTAVTFPPYCFEEPPEEITIAEETETSPLYWTTTVASRKRRDTSENDTELTTQDYEHIYSQYSEKFKTCSHIIIEEGCYLQLPNGSVFVHQLIFKKGDYRVVDGSLFVCEDHMPEPEEKFDRSFGVVSQIGLVASTICIGLHLIMFAIIPSMRNLPGYCLVSLCVALIIAYICFLCTQHISDDSCKAVGMLMHYFFLSSFFWMNVLSYDVCRSLRMATCKLRLATHVWLRFGMYSFYAWGSALFVVIVSVVIDQLADVNVHYKLVFREKTCWFQYKEALLVYFAAPLFFMLVTNTFFFSWSLLMITGAAMKTAENRNYLWQRFCIFLRLFVAMGLTWVSGALAAATDAKVFQYLFVIFATSQGVLIFFSFTFTKKVQRALSTRVRGRKVSSNPTQTSFHSSNHVSTV